MSGLVRGIGSLAAGVLAFLAVTAGLTAALSPYIWPAPLVAIPWGIASGVAVTALTYVGLTIRSERRQHGEVRERTRRRLLRVAGGTVGFLAGGVLTAVVGLGTGGGVASSTFTGLPVGLVGAVVGGVLAVRLSGSDDGR